MYLCHVGQLANYPVVANALTDPSGGNMRRFIHAMKGQVDRDAHKDHDKFGIGAYTEWKVTGGNARELLECIREAIRLRWDDLDYREIRSADIPERLSYELAEANGSPTIFQEDPSNEIANGALRGQELAGFASGRITPTLELSLRNYYVGEEYRHGGVGNRLLEEMERLSKSKKLNQVDRSRVDWTIAKQWAN